MAYKVSDCGGYGNGRLGDFTIAGIEDVVVNSYASINRFVGKKIKIANKTVNTSNNDDFTVGMNVMVHISSTINASPEGYKDLLGKYAFLKVEAVNGDEITLDKGLNEAFNTTFKVQYPEYTDTLQEPLEYHLQIITIPEYKSIDLKSGFNIVPLNCTCNASATYGGIVIFKANEELKLNGGHIKLEGKGLGTGNSAYRPLMTQEANGTGYTNDDNYAGWENHITVRNFLLNTADGASYIFAKKLTVANSDSRIGNSTKTGTKRTRAGMAGGSTIALITDEIEGFVPQIISKTNSVNGQGLARCYIASETILPNDEMLYAYDIISNPKRLKQKLNVCNFGDGSMGNVVNPTVPINNYAYISSWDENGYTLFVANVTTNGLVPFEDGALVMVHASQIKTSGEGLADVGVFKLAKIVSRKADMITLNISVSDVLKDTCDMQIITIPQVANFLLNNEHKYTYTPKYDAANKVGGIFAIACSNSFKMEANTQVNLVSKGVDKDYGQAGLDYIGHAQNAYKLVVSCYATGGSNLGCGTAFILANEVQVDKTARIGGTNDGASMNIDGTAGASDGKWVGGALGHGYYSSVAVSDIPSHGANLMIIANVVNVSCTSFAIGTNGGAGGGHGMVGGRGGGGRGSVGGAGYSGGGGGGAAYYYSQGPSYSDGGKGGNIKTKMFSSGAGVTGSPGYSGSGEKTGSSGGSCGGISGWAFIYCNKVIEEDTTGVVLN